MASIRHPVTVLFTSLLLALPALAVGSGHVQGYVLDGSGLPVAGALVTVTGEGAVGRWTCTTSPTGFFRVAGLDVAQVLTVRAEAPGLVPVVRTGYRLGDNQTLRLEFRLLPEGVHDVLVIVDTTVPYHMRALAGVLATLPPEARVFEAADRSPETIRALNADLRRRPEGILAIGDVAAHLAVHTTTDLPVVHALVPDPWNQGLIVSNLCGVPANGFFEDQLDVLIATAPEVRKVGTLFVPTRHVETLARLRAAAAERGLEIEARSLHDPSDLHDQILSLRAAEIDAFLLLLDPALWTPEVLEEVAALAESDDILLMLPDDHPTGNLVGVSYVPDVEELGAFAGGLLHNILHGRTTTAEVGLTYPPAGLASLTPAELERIREIRDRLAPRRGPGRQGGSEVHR